MRSIGPKVPNIVSCPIDRLEVFFGLPKLVVQVRQVDLKIRISAENSQLDIEWSYLANFCEDIFKKRHSWLES